MVVEVRYYYPLGRAAVEKVAKFEFRVVIRTPNPALVATFVLSAVEALLRLGVSSSRAATSLNTERQDQSLSRLG
jgi:hypothetical protein